MTWWVASLFVVAISLSTRASALELTENFGTRSQWNNGTAVWNQALGMVHPSLYLVNYKIGYTTPLNFSVGDGRHGAFVPATYANFSVGGNLAGNIIRLDTSVYSTLQVTRFQLDQGWFLEPVGNNPLIIQSLSDVQIQGEIWCHGEPGGDAVGVTPGAGGAGRCGGTSGGSGGAPGSNGQSGTDAHASVTGGRGGNNVGASFVGGGGGGSWSTSSPPTNGPNSSVSGGLAGAFSSDPEFLNPLGAAGGGGGSGDVIAGGGGGGGGGVVIIQAVGNVEIGDAGMGYGFIYASGGDGGDATQIAPPESGGPGGGGGGGSVKIFSGGDITIHNNAGLGASRALGGMGGTNQAAAVGADGGLGRSWIAGVNFFGPGNYQPSEEAPVLAANSVEFNSSAQFVETNTIDLASTKTRLESLTFSPISGDFSFQVSGSDDNFVLNDTGWTTSLSAVSQKRYVKLRFYISTSNVLTPTMINSATLTYQVGIRDEFDFKAAGCGRVTGSGPTKYDWSNLFLLLLLPMATFFYLKFKSQRDLSTQ